MNSRLRKHLLACLRAGSGFVLPECVLGEECAPVWTLSEMRAELRRLEGDGLAAPGRNPLGELAWQLTAAGQAACAELGL